MTDERKLADLTDMEILDLTNKIKTTESEKQPLVAIQEPITILLQEYEGAQTYQSKIMSLSNDWKSVRRVRGDGDCKNSLSIQSYNKNLENLKSLIAD